MVMDDGWQGRPWWEELSAKTARDPMGAIYDTQVEISTIEEEVKKCQGRLEQHQKRLDFLRDVVRRRMGEPVETIA